MAGSFRVVYSGSVQRALKELLERIPDKNLTQGAIQAIKIIDERLRDNPREFGEPRYHLEQLQLEIRVGVVLPIAVHFGVHASEPLVFVSKHNLVAK